MMRAGCSCNVVERDTKSSQVSCEAGAEMISCQIVLFIVLLRFKPQKRGRVLRQYPMHLTSCLCHHGPDSPCDMENYQPIQDVK